MLDVLLTAAFDATPSKLEVAGPPLLACLRAASRAAARCTSPVAVAGASASTLGRCPLSPAPAAFQIVIVCLTTWLHLCR